MSSDAIVAGLLSAKRLDHLGRTNPGNISTVEWGSDADPSYAHIVKQLQGLRSTCGTYLEEPIRKDGETTCRFYVIGDTSGLVGRVTLAGPLRTSDVVFIFKDEQGKLTMLRGDCFVEIALQYVRDKLVDTMLGIPAAKTFRNPEKLGILDAADRLRLVDRTFSGLYELGGERLAQASPFIVGQPVIDLFGRIG